MVNYVLTQKGAYIALQAARAKAEFYCTQETPDGWPTEEGEEMAVEAHNAAEDAKDTYRVHSGETPTNPHYSIADLWETPYYG